MVKKMHMAMPYAMRTPITAQQVYVNVLETPLGNIRRYSRTIEIFVRTTRIW
jgi:hypothetical protein